MLNLIIDGNFLLNRFVFPLVKANQLYGLLHRSLEKSISNYRTWYPFNNIFFVSDSSGSWRKKIYGEYKANRSKDSEIDWDFVYVAYDEFKKSLPKHIKVLEQDLIEGDDWIWGVVKKSNELGYSNLIISNDYDIKQLIDLSISDKSWINLMTNEFYGKEKVFLPTNYHLFLDYLNNNKSNDIFNLDDNQQIFNFLESFILRRDINIVNNLESLFVKIVSGDKSDNINSVYQAKTANGKTRGIGDKGAKKLWDIYIKEFGSFRLSDSDISDNIADIILESKGMSLSGLEKVSKSVHNNMLLTCLDLIPNNIKTIIDSKINIA